MKSYVAAIDAGTGGVRCVVFDAAGNAVAQHYRELHTLYTSDGRAEQDPQELISGAYEAVRGALSGGDVNPDSILGISVAATQTSIVPEDRDGNFLGSLILWQDMRGTEMFPWIRERLARAGMTEEQLYARTLKPVDTLLSGAKLIYLRQREPELYAKAHRIANHQAVVLRAFGAEECTIDVTDVGWWLSHDSITLRPDDELIRLFEMDPALFPVMKKPGEMVGRVTADVAAKTGLRVGTPLFQGAVDQCCAALGAGNWGTGEMGTMCMGTAGVIMTYSDEPIPDPLCKYYVIHYPTGGFAGEVAVAVAASAFRWTRDMLYPAGAFEQEGVYARMDAEAAKVPVGAGGLAFLPHLAGSIYPVTNAALRGGFVGVSLSTTRADMVRAALEGISYGMRQILDASGSRFTSLRLLGGAARSQLWNQMQADVYGCPVETVTEQEASALGAAMIAATGAGMYDSLPEAVRGMSSVARRYEPDLSKAAAYEDSYRAWLRCLEGLVPDAFPALAAVREKA